MLSITHGTKINLTLLDQLKIVKFKHFMIFKKINGKYLMNLYLKAFVILKFKYLKVLIINLLLEFAHKKDQIEMERIKMVGLWEFMIVNGVWIIMEQYIIMWANHFMLIGD